MGPILCLALLERGTVSGVVLLAQNKDRLLRMQPHVFFLSTFPQYSDYIYPLTKVFLQTKGRQRTSWVVLFWEGPQGPARLQEQGSRPGRSRSWASPQAPAASVTTHTGHGRDAVEVRKVGISGNEFHVDMMLPWP